jgi:hypothetical protein
LPEPALPTCDHAVLVGHGMNNNSTSRELGSSRDRRRRS